jgi:hypothetical protein
VQLPESAEEVEETEEPINYGGAYGSYGWVMQTEITRAQTPRNAFTDNVRFSFAFPQ